MTVDRTSSERQKRYRAGIKQEDSTCGSSAIKPVTYKKDIPVQAWMDSRYLATLSEWLDRDIYNRTRRLSEIIQLGIQSLVDHLIKCGEVEMVDDSVDAQEMLKIKYGIVIREGYGARGRNNRTHNAVLTEQRRELAGSIERCKDHRDIKNQPVYETNINKVRVTDEEYERQMGRSREEIRELANKALNEKRDKAIEKQKANAQKDSHLIDIGDGIAIDLEDSQARAEANDKALEEML